MSKQFKINSNKISFAVITVLLLHIARNITSLYFAALIVLHLVSIIFILLNVKRFKINKINLLVLVYFIHSCLIFLHTTYHLGVSSAFYGLIRYLFVLSFYPLFTLTLNEKQVNQFLFFTSYYILLSLLFIPIQMFILKTPIPFFADPGERAGLIRYSTNLGSLTVSGVAALIAIIIFDGIGKRLILSRYVTIILGFFTLQKAFIGGLLIILVKSFYQKKSKIRLFFWLIVTTTVITYSVQKIENQNIELITKYFTEQIKGNTGDSGDVSVLQSVRSRLTGDLVNQSLEWLYIQEGFIGFFIGGGFGMLGPALVPKNVSNFYTSHNQFIDFILVGGVFHLLLILYIIIESIKSLRKDNSITANRLKRCFVMIILLSFFGGGITFQPVIALFFWITVSYSSIISYK